MFYNEFLIVLNVYILALGTVELRLDFAEFLLNLGGCTRRAADFSIAPTLPPKKEIGD